jgi:tRNA 2-thiouridine synthesizing protein C
MNKVAILMRKPPYGSAYSAEAFRTIMGIAVFELDICVVFVDDGVYVLAKDQQPGKLEMKPLGEGFPTLKDFSVNRFVVHEPSLTERGLKPEDLTLEVELADDAKVAQILGEYEKVLPF